MQYRTIKLHGLKRYGTGAFSAYYRLNSRQGVKVLGLGDYSPIEPYATKQALIQAGMGDALLEFSKYQALRGKRIICKAYAVVAVKTSEGWLAGIVLQHAVGKPLAHWDLETLVSLLAKAKIEFKRIAGYEHPDLHAGNVIYNGRTLKVIDFADTVHA